METTKKSKKGLILGIVLGVIAVILAVAVFLLFQNRKLTEQERQQIINSGTFHPGIQIAGVDVSGMTLEDAKLALGDVEKELASQVNYTLKYNEQSYELSAENFGIEYTTDAVLNEAMMLARDGSLTELKAELADIEANGRTFEINYTLDAEPVKEVIAQIAAEIDSLPVNATFTINPDSVNTTTEAKKDTEAPAESTDAEASEEANGRFIYVESVDGITVDQDALYSAISGMAAEKQYGEVEIPFITTPAEVSAETLKSNLVLRGYYSSSFASGNYDRDTRVHNIKKAAGLVNGTVLEPGQEFSTNDTLGYRTYANGWQPAPAVIEGGASSEDQPGGGVCQVSSTLYNAVLLSDLEVIYRQAHSAKLSYVPGGLDATIDSGRIDFKWKNSTSSPIYVFCWVQSSNKTVHVEIYGEPFPETFDEIRVYSKQLERLTPGPDEYTFDSSLPSGSIQLRTEKKSGSIWQSYREYYKDGVQVGETELIAKTTYKAHPNRYIYGPGYVPGSGVTDSSTSNSSTSNSGTLGGFSGNSGTTGSSGFFGGFGG